MNFQVQSLDVTEKHRTFKLWGTLMHVKTSNLKYNSLHLEKYISNLAIPFQKRKHSWKKEIIHKKIFFEENYQENKLVVTAASSEFTQLLLSQPTYKIIKFRRKILY